ncbi:MAG: DUF2892 domain-containing protein [Alphaproteobacteria bacterium]|nr:DUF2892 domain-containing protein [Alphaproteobacteria bacterium]
MLKVKKNVGAKDRMARMAVGVVLIVAGLAVQGPLGGVLIFVAAVMFLTSALKFCPAYTLLGLNTCCGGSCESGACKAGEDKASGEASE